MNPRRVHELMRQRFPAVRGASREWVVIADEHGLRPKVLEALIDDHVGADDVIVEASRKVGDLLSKQAALEFVGAHLGRGEIRLANRDFNGFVVVAQNGVATGWTTGVAFGAHDVGSGSRTPDRLQSARTSAIGRSKDHRAPAPYAVGIPCAGLKTPCGS